MAFHIGKNCRIHPSVQLNVNHGYIGDNALVFEGVKIEGERVEIGREAYIDRYAVIGGGSAFDPDAFLKAGDWFHLGSHGQVNLARGVTIGHEFGGGVETKIFTHGSWLNPITLGAPVQWGGVEIGDSVWLPNAWVNPGVKIGSDVMVAARSLINRDLPSGCFAAGSPVKVLDERRFPKILSAAEKQTLLAEVMRVARRRFEAQPNSGAGEAMLKDDKILSGETVFDLTARMIAGPATPWTLMLKDQLRRNGIRFRFKSENDLFIPWKDSLFEM